MITEEIRHRVPFHDVDVLMVAWHGHYFKYLELARTALMKRAGLDWPALRDLGIAMPVVNVTADYRHAIQYDQEIIVRVSCADPLDAALMLSYEIMDADSRRVLARATTRQVYVSLEHRKLLFGLPEAVERGFRSMISSSGGTP